MDLTTNKRREFLKSMGLISAGTYVAGIGALSLSSCDRKPTFNKREAILNLLTTSGKQD